MSAKLISLVEIQLILLKAGILENWREGILRKQIKKREKRKERKIKI